MIHPTSPLEIPPRNHQSMGEAVEREGVPLEADPQTTTTTRIPKIQRIAPRKLIPPPEQNQTTQKRQRKTGKNPNGNANGVADAIIKLGAKAAPNDKRRVDYATAPHMISNSAPLEKTHQTARNVTKGYMKTPRSVQYG